MIEPAAGHTEKSLSPAFLDALQQLPPRQRAVLILGDVLGWELIEIAELLGTTVASVEGTLRQARSALAGPRCD